MSTDRAPRREQLLDSIVLFLSTAVLLLPLWRIRYLSYWSSIESTFIADGHLLRENWTHHLWQPLWYCGTRAGYIYPPGLSYGVAILGALLRDNFALAYHILIAAFYAIGTVAVYLFVRAAGASRRAAWLASAGLALASPCFLLLANYRHDSLWRAPLRLHVLMAYGEGPHMSSLAILPLVWLAAAKRFRQGDLRWLALSAGAAAVVVSINFYGATALAITFPLLVWSFWLKNRSWQIPRDALCIAALAYGLCAWWLVPSFLRVTMRNLSLVSPAGNKWSFPLAAALLAAYLLATFSLSRDRRISAYSIFVWSGLAFLGAFTLGYQWFRFQVAGDPMRLLPEFDLFAILCLVQIVEALWHRQPTWLKVPAVALILLCLFPTWRYLRHPYAEFPRDRQWRERVEYKTATWLQQNYPQRRVFVTGSIRFWHNVWSDVPQADGGSLQGILNPLIPTAQWRLLRDKDPLLARNWLQALGVDVIVVPGPQSQERFQELVKSVMYDDWPLVRDDGEGNRYYSTGRRVPGIVRIVNRSRIESLPPIPSDNEQLQIQAYASAVEAVPSGGDDRQRTRYRWNGSDQWQIEAQIQPGESLLLQENYDPYWRAYVDGQPQTIRRDALGFMLLDLTPGQHTARLVFETPAEVTIGRLLTLVSLLAIAILLGIPFYRARVNMRVENLAAGTAV
jgi:hypothetical protein